MRFRHAESCGICVLFYKDGANTACLSASCVSERITIWMVCIMYTRSVCIAVHRYTCVSFPTCICLSTWLCVFTFAFFLCLNRRTRNQAGHVRYTLVGRGVGWGRVSRVEAATVSHQVNLVTRLATGLEKTENSWVFTTKYGQPTIIFVSVVSSKSSDLTDSAIIILCSVAIG